MLVTRRCTNYESGLVEVGAGLREHLYQLAGFRKGPGRPWKAVIISNECCVYLYFAVLSTSCFCFFILTDVSPLPSLSQLPIFYFERHHSHSFHFLPVFQYKYPSGSFHLSFFVTFIDWEEARGAQGMEEGLF